MSARLPESHLFLARKDMMAGDSMTLTIDPKTAAAYTAIRCENRKCGRQVLFIQTGLVMLRKQRLPFSFTVVGF